MLLSLLFYWHIRGLLIRLLFRQEKQEAVVQNGKRVG